MTSDQIRARVESVCAGAPFALTRAQTPFSFDLQPSGAIDDVFRLEQGGSEVIGGFNYSEDRTDELQLWVAKKYQGDPEGTYQRLLTDASSVRAAVIRDGLSSGDYIVPDTPAGFSVQRDPGKEYAVLRLTIGVNYEATT